MKQATLPDCDGLIHAPVPDGWRPDELPSLDGIHELGFDTETTGLRWWKGDLPVGLSVSTPGMSCYLPWAHRGGGNHDEATVKRWAERELRNKRLVGLNVRFDAHMMREWGIDLEAQGCTFGDIGHYAALLDDNRYSFSLESVSQTYLREGKITGLSGEHIADYHAFQVTPYGRRDVELVTRLIERMTPDLEAEDLLRVAALEDQVIPAVIEMERNATRIDVEKLNRWVLESERELYKRQMALVEMTGFACNPARNGDMIRLFETQGIPITSYSEKTGKPSFDAEVMVKAGKTNAAVELAYRITKLTHLRSKFLVCYQRCIDHKGTLRTSFHQCRADEGGTVSGRFSSSAPLGDDPTSGVNLQQVFSTAKQTAMHGDNWIVRELFVPGSGLFYASDAEQIEFRLFAHYSGSIALIQAYKDDPKTDFHSVVMRIIQRVRPETTRKTAKDCNFAKIYGAGQSKVAAMLGMSPEEAQPFIEAYDAAFPEAHILLRKASNAARQRGWVKTMSGRRARFPDRQWLHSALNRVIQGTAADHAKMKLVELHNERKRTGFVMRATVHDEVIGDVPDIASAAMCDEILNRQTLPTSVPLLWSGKTGANWRVCK